MANEDLVRASTQNVNILAVTIPGKGDNPMYVAKMILCTRIEPHGPFHQPEENPPSQGDSQSKTKNDGNPK